MSPLGKTYRQVLDQSDSIELVLEIPSFAGGENTVGQDQELKINEARTIENWDSDSLGGMIRSKGFTLIASSLTGIDSFTKLMLHGNGTDASTTITDSSSSPHTMTAVGDAQIDTAQSKFGGASILFDGTGDYVTTPDSDDFSFGTGDFTIDFWIRFNSTAACRFCGQDNGGTTYWYIEKQSNAGGNKLSLLFVSAGVTIASYVMTSAWSDFATGTWFHLAFVRTTTTARIFINGTSQSLTAATTFGTGNVGNAAAVFELGRLTSDLVNGWIDEFRISKGVARWTANFTPAGFEYAVAYTAAGDGLLHHFEGSSTRNYIVIEGDIAYITSSSIVQTDNNAFTSGVLTHGVSAGSKAWFTNSTDNLKYTTIAGNITVPASVPSSARERVYFHKSRLIAEGGGVTVYGSRAGTGNFTAVNAWSASGDAWNIDLPDLTQGCAPGFPSGGQITVFTKFGAYALTNMPNVAQNYILGSHGCSQPQSIQLGAEGIYFFSLFPTLGVYLWDGASWINLTVNETWVNQISLTNRCFGIYSENKYRFIYNDNTSGVSYPNVMRIYDARWGRWMNRVINASVADNFGVPMLLTKANNELYVSSSRSDEVYQLEDTSNSDNTYATQANYKTKDFTSKDFGMERDEVRLKLLKATITFFGTIGLFSLQWTSDRGLHSGSITLDLQAPGDLLNTTFILNTSSVVSAASIPDKTVTRSFNNTAVGRRFSFQLLNQGTGERVKIKKIKISAIALEEA